MRKLLTIAIPLLLGVGVLTALVHSDPQSGETTRQQSGVAAITKSLPAVIEERTSTVSAPGTETAARGTTTICRTVLKTCPAVAVVSSVSGGCTGTATCTGVVTTRPSAVSV